MIREQGSCVLLHGAEKKKRKILKKKKKIKGKKRKKAKERVVALVKPVLRCGPEKCSWGELPREDT